MSDKANNTPNTPGSAQRGWTPLKALKKAVSLSPDPASPAATSAAPATPTPHPNKGKKENSSTISSPFGLRVNPHLPEDSPGSPFLASHHLTINTLGAIDATSSKTVDQGDGKGLDNCGSPSPRTPSSRRAGVPLGRRSGFLGIENSPFAAAFSPSASLPPYSLEETESGLVKSGSVYKPKADPFVAAGNNKLATTSAEREALAIPSRAGTRDEEEISEALKKKLEMQSAEQQKAELTARGQAYFASINPNDGTDQRLAETLIRNIVAGAGGEMVTDYVLPGGVAFRIPSTSHLPCPDYLPSPYGGHINISLWTPFAPRAADPLGSHPPSAMTQSAPSSASKPVNRASTMAAINELNAIKEWVDGVDTDEGEALADNLGKMKIKKMGAGLD